MRIGILIRDTEYREALVQKLSTYDNNIFVNIKLIAFKKQKWQ